MHEDLLELETLLAEAHLGPYAAIWSTDMQTVTILRSDGTNQIPVFTATIDGTVLANQQMVWLMVHSWDLAWVIAELRQKRELIADLEQKANRENPVIEAVLRLFAAYPNLNLPGTISQGFRTRFAEVKTAYLARQAEVQP